MRTKIITAFVAGGLLVGAGLIAAVISTPDTARAQEQPDETEDRGPMSRVFGFLGEVLEDLVGDGTITQDQADAIVDAAESKVEELRDEHRALHDQLSEILEDGFVTEEEASVLPDDHWLFAETFDEAWEDGELTIEDIRNIRPFPRGHDFRRGFRFGALLDDGGIDHEEYDSLNDEHPLKQLGLGQYLEDGLITPDEFRQIFSDLRGSFGEDA